LPDVARAISGKTFELSYNAMGLTEMTLHFTPDSPEAELDLALGGMTLGVTIGLDGAYRTSDLLGQRWAYRGQWVDDATFLLEQEVPGKVLRRRAKLTFEGDALELEVYDRVSGVVETHGATAKSVR
jgi:hypothetical protein